MWPLGGLSCLPGRVLKILSASLSWPLLRLYELVRDLAIAGRQLAKAGRGRVSGGWRDTQPAVADR
jgi:hypothetical protein